MSYVDAYYDRKADTVLVAERVDGKRVYKEYPAEYTMYVEDHKKGGKYTSIFDTPLTRITCKTHKEFAGEKRLNSGKRLFESDIQPVQRCLEQYYKGVDAPKLQTAFFDIEVDFDNVKGFSPTNDPFNKITAISIYLDWLEQLVTLVIPPKTISFETAKEIVAKFDNTFLYLDEAEMLKDFLKLIEDADILSGWNSEGYDIPYTINRITRVLSKNDTRDMCLWNLFPKGRTFERFGAENSTYDLIGRIHLDYMQLYRKYTYHEMHSYSLDAIGEYELNERKVAYDGTLDQLYNNDFPTFIDYNRQDTMLLHKLDAKLKFIDLANAIAHENTVLLPKVMGAVAVTEQAIINEIHERGYIAPDKVRHEEGDTQAAGAYVAYPKKGLHKWVGSVDINSLYPSAIRALNMANETIVGQFRSVDTDKKIAKEMEPYTKNGRQYVGKSFTAAWEGLFGTLEYTAVMERRPDFEIIVDWEEGKSDTFTAKDLHDYIFSRDCNWGLSANGTIFTYEKEGIIPGLLKRWYAERKQMQAELKKAYAAGDKDLIEYWDKRQLVKKINLNSLYGAILNPHCRFFDKRIGQSTTLTGRSIARHMDAYVNQCLTGEYDHLGETIIYGDTDSAYFSAWPVIKEAVEKGEQEWNTETAIALYDSLADEVNKSFPIFMEKEHHCPREYGELIRCGREVVGSAGLFITKKRYAINVIDSEGNRQDVDGKTGKVKAMGLDLKRSDTAPIIQDFLMELLVNVLNEPDRQNTIDMIIEFKKFFDDLPPWEKGSPKRVNNLTKYSIMEEDSQRKHGKPARLPGHVRAAINYNKLRKLNGDNQTMEITDGMKCIVCKLKNNAMGITSIARPTDETQIPQWFKDLPFDEDIMRETGIDKKVDNLLGVLNWGLKDATDLSTTFNKLFSFE